MAYEVWWALVLGFAISAIVQAWVPRERVERALAGSGPGPVLRATGLGAASSSCSYAAIAIARSLFEKGASAATALAFQFASTNLVWELGLVLWILIGWQFTLAEFVGGFILIGLMAALLRLFVSPRLEERARDHAREAAAGHEHHHGGAARGQPAGGRGSPRSTPGPDVAGNFRADWAMLWKEITIGFLLAGFIGLLGDDFFSFLFVEDAPPVAADDRERDRRAADRRAELRLLDRQRPAGRRAVVGGDLVRRRDGVHLRRPDRAPDRDRLPQVLRRRVRAADHGADVRDDGDRGAGRRRPVLGSPG